jgi:TldD protein
MRDVVRTAVEAAVMAGAGYADARIVAQEHESVHVKSGHVDGVKRSRDEGIGVRTIVDGAWGFAATADLTPDGVAGAAKEAVRIARAGARVNTDRVELSPLEPVVAEWESGCEKDPFGVPLEEKAGLLLEMDGIMRRTPEVKVTESFLNSFRFHKFFASSEGLDIRQRIVECGGQLQATAVDEHEVQTRSWPSALEGYHAQAGWEIVEQMELEKGARQIGVEAAQLLKAPECPSDTMTLILDGSQLALQVHESCGHPIELDRVFGTELSLAGGSFLQPDKVGFRYGSEHVTIVADATTPGGLGTFAYDDEGVPAQRTEIVKNGIFTGYISSRETAPRIGRTSQGAMRADGWQNIPLIRMTNINLEPGAWTLAEMIADTKKGILMQDTKSWSIDDLRLNFQFACEIGWLIENGQITGMVRNPSYQGITPEFWNNCDAVANREVWRVWGVLNCGKGVPMQTMHVGHGASRARFRNVKVGIK